MIDIDALVAEVKTYHVESDDSFRSGLSFKFSDWLSILIYEDKLSVAVNILTRTKISEYQSHQQVIEDIHFLEASERRLSGLGFIGNPTFHLLGDPMRDHLSGYAYVIVKQMSIEQFRILLRTLWEISQ